MKTLSNLTFTLLLATMTTAAHGQDDDNRRGERRGPPPVAIEACVAAVEGDVCAFEGRQGENLEGLCAVTPEETLACRPEGGPPHPGRGGHEDASEQEG